jgi:hypothetical protein
MCVGTSCTALATTSACAQTQQSGTTYYGTTTSGTDVYVTSSGTYVDENGNSLSAAQVASADAATGDAGGVNPNATPVPAQSSLHTAAPAATVNSPGSGGSSMSGIGTLFGAIGTAFGTAVNPPKTVAGVNLVYNPATGQYVPAGGTGATATTSLTTYLIIGAVAVGLLFVILAEKG